MNPLVFAWAQGMERLPERARESLCGLVVHRIEVSQEDATFGDSPSEVARFFREQPVGVAASGGAMPYPILVGANGTVTQCVPLLRRTPHAKAWNDTHLGVGLIGDFRVRAPAPEQYRAAVRVCAALCAALGLSEAQVVGHDELAGGSSDPNKECPGRALSLPDFRREVALLLAQSPAPGAWPWVW